MKHKVLFYTKYERIWHWVQGFGIILLILSGFQIHYPDKFPVFSSFTQAVNLHIAIGLILLANAFLALFYNLATNKMREYIPMPMDFSRGMIAQARYYLWGIFHNAPHPYEKTPEKRLNPLQKITYFFLLNILLPFQIITGILLWSASVNPTIPDHFGGLQTLGLLHSLGAFFFLSFLLIHIYLTTTGETPLEMIKQMIFGYGEIHTESENVKS